MTHEVAYREFADSDRKIAKQKKNPTLAGKEAVRVGSTRLHAIL